MLSAEPTPPPSEPAASDAAGPGGEMPRPPDPYRTFSDGGSSGGGRDSAGSAGTGSGTAPGATPANWAARADAADPWSV